MTAALALPTPATVPAPRVVLRAAPRREPAFDDELPPGIARPGRHDRHLPFERVPAPLAWRPPLAGRTALPDPAPWSRRLLVGMIETAAGRRPLPQLAALLSPSVASGLGADFERAAGRGRPHWLHRAGVRSVHATQPSPGVAEIAATVDVGDRVRAVALRLETRHGRWRCTRLQLG